MGLDIIFTSDNIKVCLTASTYSPCLVDPDQSQGEYDALVSANIPVCVVVANLSVKGSDIEKVEHMLSVTAKNMAKTVFVDSAKNHVFIGIDPTDEMTGLVTYTTEKRNRYEDEFFKRWDKIKALIFEFQTVSIDKQDVFTIKGLWIQEHWHSLEICPSSKIHVM